MEILRFGDTTTSEFLSKISLEKFERFEVSLSSFRDRENPHVREREGERERARERERERERELFLNIFYYILNLLYILNIF